MDILFFDSSEGQALLFLIGVLCASKSPKNTYNIFTILDRRHCEIIEKRYTLRGEERSFKIYFLQNLPLYGNITVSTGVKVHSHAANICSATYDFMFSCWINGCLTVILSKTTSEINYFVKSINLLLSLFAKYLRNSM